MTLSKTRALAALVLLVAALGCSKKAPDAARVEPSTASKLKAPTACAMVTAGDMSRLADAAVSAEGEEGVGTTTCRYKPAAASLPFVEIKIEWGNGGVALMASGVLGRLEPGISNRLAGLGDEASAIGPVLMIRTGDDLINLTLIGIDDDVATAKRIVDMMRPRMGPSAQARAREADSNHGATRVGGSHDLAGAGQVVSDLLGRINQPADRSDASNRPGTSAAPNSRASSAPDDELSLSPATGPQVRVPLVAGLTLVAAEYEPGRGDYEPIVTISRITNDTVSAVFSANLPEGVTVQIDRAVRRIDLQQARGHYSWYQEGDPLVFPGMTAFSVSAAVLDDLKTKGQADVTRRMPEKNPLAEIFNLFSNASGSKPLQAGILRRIEPHAVAFPVLLNDEPADLHAIHARGTFENATIDFHLLDDADNPLLLRVAGTSSGRLVRIAFPTPTAAPIEEKLKKDSRVALHGIYFDFGQASLRPESEPVLRDIAAALTHNPDWKITIEGHTDNVGGDRLNLDLSRRRAEAVKLALIDWHGVRATRLTAAGFGASRPNASNDSLSGRALNRRVELARQ